MSRLARAGLGLVAAGQAELGVWGEVSPRGLFDNWPGFGHHWIAAAGAYDEHLIRDYASAEIGLAVLLLCGAVWFERRVVLVVAAAFLAATVPHFIYHLATTDVLPAADNVASLCSFAIEIAIVSAAAVAVSAKPRGAADVASRPRQTARP